MNEENSNKETNVKATIDAVTGLAKAIPVYDDAIQPAAKEVGKSLVTVAKTVNIALSPIKAMVWGYDQIENFIIEKVSKKLENIPEEKIITPNPQIAGPTIENLRYVGNNENLRELYANLLATSMNEDTLHLALPSYVDVIKNLCSDEAILLKIFKGNNDSYPLLNINKKNKTDSGGVIVIESNFNILTKDINIKRKDLVSVYIDNLERQGIVEIPHGRYFTEEGRYTEIENIAKNKYDIELIKESDYSFERKIVRLTNFGRLFIKNIV